MIGRTFCLSHSIQTYQIFLLPGEPVTKSLRLPVAGGVTLAVRHCHADIHNVRQYLTAAKATQE